MVVDRPATVGAVVRDMIIVVGCLPGLSMHQIADLGPGNAKTGAKEAAAIRPSGPHRLAPCDERTHRDLDDPDAPVGVHADDRHVAHRQQKKLAARIGVDTTGSGISGPEPSPERGAEERARSLGGLRRCYWACRARASGSVRAACSDDAGTLEVLAQYPHPHQGAGVGDERDDEHPSQQEHRADQ